MVWKNYQSKIFRDRLHQETRFSKGNPVGSNTVCYLCDFPFVADIEKGWFDFVVGCEYLFLKNIYTYDDLKQINIENEENYEEILLRLIQFYPLFENALKEVNCAMK